MRIEYLYRRSLLKTPEHGAAHDGVLRALAKLEQRGVRCSTHDVEHTHPGYEAQTELIESLRLRDFAMQRKVGLGARAAETRWS